MGLMGRTFVTNQTPKLSQKSGSNTLYIDRQTDSAQLLLTVCRNGAEWLSPVGWGPVEKGTLLDCRKSADGCEIDIPKEYAAHLSSGDELHVKCHELSLDSSVKWKSASSPKASGLLSRFGSGAEKASAATTSLTDTERRARDAQKAADDIREQMEEAQRAKEAAHQRALDAARLAEEARRAEERRIAEMEKASLALAEAQAQREQELATLEAERRAEEARRIEEARIAEEARLAELARMRAQEIAQEKSALRAELDELTLRQQRDTQSVSDLEHEMRKAKNAAADKLTEVQTLGDTLTLARDSLASQTERLSVADSAHQAAQSKLSGIENVLAETQAEDQKVQGDIAMAQSVYDKAQAEADAAVSHAKVMKKAWEAAREQRSSVTNTLTELAARRDMETKATAKSARALQALSQDHAQVAGRVESLQEQIASLSSAQAERKSEAQRLEADYLRANYEHAKLTERAERTKDALQRLDEGADLDAVRDMLSAPSQIDAPKLPRDDAPQEQSASEPLAEKLSKIARRFKRSKTEENLTATEVESSEPAVSKPVAVIMAAAAASATIFKPAAAADSELPENEEQALQQTPSAEEAHIDNAADQPPMADNDRGPLMPILMASAATVAIVAVVGVVSMSGPNHNEVVVAGAKADAPTQVLSKTTAATTPLELGAPEGLESAVPAPTAEEVEAQADEKAETETEPSNEAGDDEVAELAKASAPAADYVHPKWMVPYRAASESAEAEEAEVKSGKKAEGKRAAPESKAVPKPKTQSVSSAAVEPKPAPKPAKAKADPQTPPSSAYIELTKDVQIRLTDLGFYSGAIDGQRSEQTLAAMRDFKSLFELEVNDDLSGEFLNELKRAGIQAAAPIYEPQVQEPILVQTPAYVEPAPTESNVVIETPPLASAEPAPQPVQTIETASLMPITPAATPVVDEIVEAKRRGALSVSYPSRVIQRGFDGTVIVKVAYRVSAQGEVENTEIVEMEGGGRYEKYFKTAALDAINGQKFEPKTVNGDPVQSPDHISKITFRLD